MYTTTLTMMAMAKNVRKKAFDQGVHTKFDETFSRRSFVHVERERKGGYTFLHTTPSHQE